MIWESQPFKADLLKRAAALRRRGDQRRWPRTSLIHVEQDLMLGFYSIRKLREARKLSESVANRVVTLSRFPPNPPLNVNHLNWHHLDRHYSLQHMTRCRKQLHYVCNQVIHSYIVIPAFTAIGGLDGFLFVSDRDRSAGLWKVDLSEVVSIFEQIALDEVLESRARWDSVRGDYVVSNSEFIEPQGSVAAAANSDPCNEQLPTRNHC